MNRNEIIDAIRSLARSQGSYGRLLDNLTDEALDYLEEQNFTDPVDLILWIEG